MLPTNNQNVWYLFLQNNIGPRVLALASVCVYIYCIYACNLITDGTSGVPGALIMWKQLALELFKQHSRREFENSKCLKIGWTIHLYMIKYLLHLDSSHIAKVSIILIKGSMIKQIYVSNLIVLIITTTDYFSILFHYCTCYWVVIKI